MQKICSENTKRNTSGADDMLDYPGVLYLNPVVGRNDPNKSYV